MKALMFGTLCVVGLWMSPVRAEVVFSTPAPKEEVGAHEYPTSRFGETPQAPEAATGSRSPAGLVVGDEARAPRPSKSRALVEREVSSGGGENTAGTSLSGPVALIPDKNRGVQEMALIAGDLGFFPRTLFVTQDIPVRLYVTSASNGSLCLMIDSFAVQKQVRSAKVQEVLFTPTQVGTYRFYCPINGSEGTLVVKEMAIR